MTFSCLIPLIIRIAFMGDINPGGEMTHTGSISNGLKEELSSYDLRVATLESSLGENIPFCPKKMSDPKGGNIIFSPDSSISILKQLGINAVSLANNHSFDCGIEGAYHTMDILEKENIEYFGAGHDKVETEEPFITIIHGKRICFLAYYPSEWKVQYIADDSIGGLNQFDLEKVINDVRNYRKTCDYVFVMPHWGKEQTMIPPSENIRMAHSIIEAGATGVIGSHTHVVQPIIKDGDGVIAMSLGNFLFPDRYIVAPRVTYYPTEVERAKPNIPRTNRYPFVKELTYKHSHERGRTGIICEVILDEDKVSFKRHYTYLDNEHNLQLKKPSWRHRIKSFFVWLWIKWKNYWG